MKCDHIIGYSTDIEGGWLTRYSRSGRDKHDLEERFNFCPECGEDIRNLNLKRHYRRKSDDSEMSPIMAELNKCAVQYMVKKFTSGNPFMRLLAPGEWTREVSFGDTTK